MMRVVMIRRFASIRTVGARCAMPLLLCLVLGTAAQAQQLDLRELGKSLGLGDKAGNILDKTLGTFRALGPIGYEEEKTIGGALATEVFTRFGGPYRDPKLLRYVTVVGLSVATHSDRGDIPYHFAILNNPVPNAFATPGGYVFVTIGLLKQIRTEAELAGVLGHEIAHIARKHALQTVQRGQALHGISQLTLTVLDKDPAMFDNLINELSTQLFERGLEQNLEYEADNLGAAYAARVGYRPDGLQNMLRRLAKQQVYSRSAWAKTHPDPQTRAASLQRQYNKNTPGRVFGKRYAIRLGREGAKGKTPKKPVRQ